MTMMLALMMMVLLFLLGPLIVQLILSLILILIILLLMLSEASELSFSFQQQWIANGRRRNTVTAPNAERVQSARV